MSFLSNLRGQLVAHVRQTAWWAPVLVLVLHKLVMLLGVRSQSDGLMHFAGGLAITYYLWSLVPLMARYMGSISLRWRAVLALATGCTVAVAWEIGEFASDELLARGVQHSLRETMLDLCYGTVGCMLTFGAILIKINRSRPAPPLPRPPRR